MRRELQCAHAEEIRRLHQEVEKERSIDKQELEKEKKIIQKNIEEEKVHLNEKLRKALEELICKHASEVHQTQASLENERKQVQQLDLCNQFKLQVNLQEEYLDNYHICTL